MNLKSGVAHIEIHIHFKIYENHGLKANSPLLLKVQGIKNSDNKSQDTLETNERRGHQQKKTMVCSGTRD